MANCDVCEGSGRVEVDEEVQPFGLLCQACGGTGDRFHALLLRAYHLGYRDGIQAMRDAMPQLYDTDQSLNALVRRVKQRDL